MILLDYLKSYFNKYRTVWIFRKHFTHFISSHWAKKMSKPQFTIPPNWSDYCKQSPPWCAGFSEALCKANQKFHTFGDVLKQIKSLYPSFNDTACLGKFNSSDPDSITGQSPHLPGGKDHGKGEANGSNSTSGGTGIGLTIAIIVGLLLAIAVIALVLFFVCNKRGKSGKKKVKHGGESAGSKINSSNQKKQASSHVGSHSKRASAHSSSKAHSSNKKRGGSSRNKKRNWNLRTFYQIKQIKPFLLSQCNVSIHFWFLRLILVVT